MLLPVLALDVFWCLIVELLVEPAGVLPGSPLTGRDLDFEHIIPTPITYQLVLTRTIDVSC